ncbi:MAG: hypothetical protein EBQ80_00445 [Proteobacteria bacterium]|nr:hypothetical protein [Pseudomonadota bacterium]
MSNNQTDQLVARLWSAKTDYNQILAAVADIQKTLSSREHAIPAAVYQAMIEGLLQDAQAVQAEITHLESQLPKPLNSPKT